MCERIAELRRAMSDVAARLNPALLAAADALRVMGDAAAIEKMAATVKGLAAARLAESEVWRRDGDRSPAHQLARTTGVSVGQAAVALDTARRLEALPVVAEAARRGELSLVQAAAIADAASLVPDTEERLVELAGRASLAELRDECARIKAVAVDPEERRRRIHAQRSLTSYCDAEGVGHLSWRDNPERIAQVISRLAPIRDRLFQAARTEGRREPFEAYAADAIVELASLRSDATDHAAGPAGGKRRRTQAGVKLIARVDLAALLRGYPITGETCELVGYGPVAVSALRDLIDTADPFLAAVATNGVQVLGVAHLGRRARAAQQTALEWLYPACAAQGCAAHVFLENDHRVDWAHTHLTILDLLDRLCSHHHDLKTTADWALVAGHGKRPFVGPDDPRHPRNAHAPPAAA